MSESKIKIRPLGQNVLLRTVEEKETVTKAGIVLPDSAKDKKPPVLAFVEATGPDVVNVEVKQKVIFAEYGFDPVKIDGIEYQIGPEEKILGIVENAS